MNRFDAHRRRPWTASPQLLRKRQFHVLNLGLWIVTYTPRDHWSNQL